LLPVVSVGKTPAGVSTGKPGQFDTRRYKDACAPLPPLRRPGDDPSRSRTYWHTLVQSIKKADLMPCLIFCFSQKEVQRLAECVMDQDFGLLTKAEAAKVHRFTSRAIQKLSPSDRNLKQVQLVCRLVECGIGMHHGGMIPLLKEVVEILLIQGFLKVVFCTSTFSMGLNVPARCTAFRDLHRFNGTDFVQLTPGEYIQMSGRAGRRGKDTTGTAMIICAKEVPEEAYLRQLVIGKSEEVKSHFYLRANMILNLIRAQSGLSIVEMLKRSLNANSMQSSIPKLKAELTSVDTQLEAMAPPECSQTDIEDTGVDFARAIFEMRKIVKKQVTSVVEAELSKQLR
jgi:antiviral helicase SKI2